MPSVILLRGINLGAKNKVDMKSLKSLFEEMGYENVQTYIQTGNVIVEQSVIDGPSLEVALLEAYGFEIPVTIRSKEELEEIQQHPIFYKDQVYVMFLTQEISEEQQEMLVGLIDDEFVVWKNRTKPKKVSFEIGAFQKYSFLNIDSFRYNFSNR